MVLLLFWAAQARGAQTRPSLHAEFEKLNNHHRAELMGQDAQQLFATATAGNNLRKNRYADILALEATRVKLKAHRELLSDDSDYINANYIDGEVPGSQRAYIACQAPLPATLSHFWLMIWESESAVIVMLTRLTERNQLKATAYWPDGVGERRQFGPYDVTHLRSEAINSHLTQRVFEVRHAGQTRQIVHLHYTEWPDFGTPRSTQTIRVLAELVDAHREAGRRAGLDGPIVTHCSAGVGRAGTFIAIHINLEKMKMKHSGSDQQEAVDIPRTVALLRQSRAGMVQTAEQYQFIYDVVRDAARERSATGEYNTALTKQHHDEI